MAEHGSTLLRNAGGLHARPVVALTKVARSFPARVQIAADAAGPWIDAGSVVQVMRMKLPAGARLHVRAEGGEAAAAVAAVIALVDNGFAGAPT